MNKMLLLFSILLVLGGCSFEAKVAEEYENVNMSCTDTRDGETFTYNTDTLKDMQVTLSGSYSFNIRDDTGKLRWFTEMSEVYYKCTTTDGK